MDTKTQASADSPALRVRGLSHSYENKRILTNINLDIMKGTLCGVIGPNGAGKSTMFKCILDLLDLDAGTIEVFSKNISEKRKEVAYVPQKDDIDWSFPATVLDVVLLGRYPFKKIFQRLDENDNKIALEALTKLDIAHLAQRQIGNLSGGQQQRVFIARALAQQAELYLLDEPFVGVDIATEQKIIQILKDLALQGKTILVVHHDLSTVNDYFDSVILINQRLIASGPITVAFTDETIARAYGGQLNLLHTLGIKVAKMKRKGKENYKFTSPIYFTSFCCFLFFVLLLKLYFILNLLSMKRFYILFLFGLSFVHCSVHNEIWINADASGKSKVTLDFNEMLPMISMFGSMEVEKMKRKDTINEEALALLETIVNREVVDTIITLSGIFETLSKSQKLPFTFDMLKDSILQVPEEKLKAANLSQEEMQSFATIIDNVITEPIRFQKNTNSNVFNISYMTEFDDVNNMMKDVNEILPVIEKLDQLSDSGKNLDDVTDNLYNQISQKEIITFDKKKLHFSLPSKVSDEDISELSDEESAQMQEMMQNMKFKYTIH